MFKNLKRISTALADVIVSVATISESVDNLVLSANHATKAVSIHAEELCKEAHFDCELAAHARGIRMKEFQAELDLESVADLDQPDEPKE